MSNTKSEIKNIFSFSISTWVNFVVGFLSTFLLTRIFLPEVLGVINLFYSTVSTLMSLFCFGLDSALIRFFYSPPKNDHKSSFIFKLVVPTLLSILLIGGTSVIFWGEEVSGFFLGERERLLCLFILIGILDQVFLRYLNIIYRMESKIKDFNIQSITINIVTKLGVLLGALVDSTSPIYALGFNILIVTIITLFYSIKQRREWLPDKMEFDYKEYNGVFKFAFWGWVSMLALQIYSLSSQLIVNNRMDLHAVGIFTSAGLFSALITVARGGFCTYWSAYMYRNYNDPEKQNYIMHMHDVILFLCILLCSAIFPLRSLLYLLIGEEFRSSKVFFSLLLFFPLLQTVQETTGYGISIKNKNYISSIIYSLALFMNISLGLFSVNKYGLTGVAFSSYISAIFMYICTTLVSQHMYKSIPNKMKSFIGISILLVQGIIPVFINSDVVLGLFMLVLVLISCILYKDVMRYCWEIIKNSTFHTIR